eukprot:403350012
MLLLNKKRDENVNESNFQKSQQQTGIPPPNSQRNVSTLIMKKNFSNFNLNKLQNFQKKLKLQDNSILNTQNHLQNNDGRQKLAVNAQDENYQSQIKYSNVEEYRSNSQLNSRESTQITTTKNSQQSSRENKSLASHQIQFQRPSALGSRKGSLTSLHNQAPQFDNSIIKQLNLGGESDQTYDSCGLSNHNSFLNHQKSFQSFQLNLKPNSQISGCSTALSQRSINESQSTVNKYQQQTLPFHSANITPVLNLNKVRQNQKLESLVLNRLAEEQIVKTQVALTSRGEDNKNFQQTLSKLRANTKSLILQNEEDSTVSHRNQQFSGSFIEGSISQTSAMIHGGDNQSFVIRKKSNKSIYQSPAKRNQSRDQSVNQSPRISKEKLIFTADKRRVSRDKLVKSYKYKQIKSKITQLRNLKTWYKKDLLLNAQTQVLVVIQEKIYQHNLDKGFRKRLYCQKAILSFLRQI